MTNDKRQAKIDQQQPWQATTNQAAWLFLPRWQGTNQLAGVQAATISAT